MISKVLRSARYKRSTVTLIHSVPLQVEVDFEEIGQEAEVATGQEAVAHGEKIFTNYPNHKSCNNIKDYERACKMYIQTGNVKVIIYREWFESK